MVKVRGQKRRTEKLPLIAVARPCFIDIFDKFGNPIEVILTWNMTFDRIQDGDLVEVCTLECFSGDLATFRWHFMRKKTLVYIADRSMIFSCNFVSTSIHWRSQRGPEGPRLSRLPSEWEKNIKASFVNLTLNMRYKYNKQYQICHHQIRFFSSSKCTKICFRPPRWGSLLRSPRPPSRLGRGIPLPHSPPR